METWCRHLGVLPGSIRGAPCTAHERLRRTVACVAWHVRWKDAYQEVVPLGMEVEARALQVVQRLEIEGPEIGEFTNRGVYQDDDEFWVASVDGLYVQMAVNRSRNQIVVMKFEQR